MRYNRTKIMRFFMDNHQGMAEKINIINSSIMIRAILLNLLYMFGMLLFFRVFFSPDDFLMSEKCYGVFEKDNDYHLSYMNYNYGKFIVFLQKHFSGFPWYTIAFYIWVFISLTLLTCIILEWADNVLGVIVCNILVMFFSFEGYIAIQFTKAAGITGAIGFFLLIYRNSSWKKRVAGAGLVILSCMIRYEVAKMVVVSWTVVFCIKAMIDFLGHRKISRKKMLQEICCLAVGIFIFLTIPKVPQYSSDENSYWSYHWQMNAVRSAIQDYKMPDYAAYKEIYEKLGISQNDIYIWQCWNADSYAMTLQRGRAIKKMQSGVKVSMEELDADNYTDVDPWMNINGNTAAVKGKQSMKIAEIHAFMKKNLDWKAFNDFCKKVPKQFFTIDVFFSYLSLILIILVVGNFSEKRVLISAGVSFFLLQLLNYYLYVHDRYLQHRVDVGLLLMASLSFLYCILDERCIIKGNTKIYLTGCIALAAVLLAGRYRNYGDDIKKVDDLTMEQNRVFTENAGKDQVYCYFLAAVQQTGVQQNGVFYGPFDVPEVGVCRNCFYGNNLYDAARRREFGIKNLFSEIVDQNIYLVMQENDTNQSAWATYFSEHSGKEASLTLVKKYMNKNIYRVYSKSLEEVVDLSNVSDGQGRAVNQLEYQISDNHLTLSGSAYLKGQTGFSQNSFVQIIDAQTGDYELYHTLQECDMDKEEEEEGYFADLSADIELPEFYDQDDIIHVIIEQDQKMYELKLR